MNSLNQLFVLMLLTSLALLSHGSTTLYEADLSHEEDEFETDAEATFEATDDDSIPLRGIGRFLAQKSKKCVDLKTDRLNCGKCGYKCKYSEICCKGKCVNPMSDKKHCGVCNNKCRHKKGKCVYGMCSYA
ncbi:hypothetical protein CDL15_Pgr012871 [Punica granatum]|uniref:Stigma-specific STIG1-like protein 1 n=1 Tax=Punica granatum TaxID=22663 RepID=A0A218XF60_PUNGR|nr:hypothetical protein CDL15_Pgr012871 [Punica granatum]